MADHYLKSLELLDELDDIRSELRRLYAEPKMPAGRPGLPRLRPPHVQRMISDLQDRKGIVLKTAEIHALLAIRQQLQDKS